MIEVLELGLPAVNRLEGVIAEAEATGVRAGAIRLTSRAPGSVTGDKPR